MTSLKHRVHVVGPHIPPVMCTIKCMMDDEAEVRRRMEADGWQTLVTSMVGDTCEYTFSRGEPTLMNALHCQVRELLS